MNSTTVIHVVDTDTRVCAQVARTAFELGHHAEVYAGLGEVCERPPQRGVIFLRDDWGRSGFQSATETLVRCGICLPVVAMNEGPEISDVVAAIKCGALDYLSVPIAPHSMADTLARIGDEIYEHAEAARAVINARRKLSSLSPREREVLDWLVQGSSNKTIALELQISPRTVEIHRANMMSKLGAHHTAEAVRLSIDAGLDKPPRRSTSPLGKLKSVG